MADDLMMMFQSITTADHDELVDQFAHLLELDTHTATFFLESSNWNVETAVNNYLATMEPALFHQHQLQQQQQLQGDDLDMDDDEDDDRDRTHQANAMAATFDAQFVTDLSAAQTTLVPPSTPVDMQWSFVNTGATPWPSDTHLVFAQGDSLDGPLQVPVASVAPGARIDLTVQLRTPPQPGAFSGSWRLVSSQGPIGEPMWLVLNVGGGGAGVPTSSKHEAFEPASVASAGLAVTAPGAAMAGPNGLGGSVGGGAGGGGFSNNDDEMMDL